MHEVEDPNGIDKQVNPMDNNSSLKAPGPDSIPEEAHPAQSPFVEDSAVTKAEKFERHGLASEKPSAEGVEEPRAKRIKLDVEEERIYTVESGGIRERQKGVAPVKLE